MTDSTGTRTQIDRDNPQKLYLQLHNIVKGKMERGEWPVDSQIRTEEELCRLFEVSKATVRIAVAELVREGFLRRQQGKGTFVCKRVIPEGLSMLTSFKEIMLEAGGLFETRVLAQTVMMMTGELELRPDVPENKHIIYLKRVRLVGEEPVLLQESYLPHSACPALLAEELEKQSILELLEERCGGRVTRVRDFIEVVALGEEEAMHRVAEGDFTATAPGPTRDAEIASLPASFSQMRDRLKDTMISLEVAVENLHDKQEQLVEVEKLASLGRVAAGVAHEINNPLAVINEKAGLLQDLLEISGEFKNRERFGPLLAGITDSVKRCRTITHRLLGFARRVEVTVEPIELNAEVRRVREYLETDRAEKGVQIDLRLTEGLPTLYTDRVEFEQVLVNIIKNAIDAVPERGKVVVTTHAKNQRRLQVVVADNGPGIPPEQVNRLFEPFFTTKAKGKGTGLGLFVSRGIMKKLGGRILVESAPGVGTNFTLELPVRHVAQEIQGE